MQSASMQAFVGHAHVITSLGQECDIVAQSCPLHLTIPTPWGPVWFAMPLILLPGGVDVVIFCQTTVRDKRGIRVMAHLKASALKAHGCEDGAEMETKAGAVGERNAGAVLRGAGGLGRAATRQMTCTMTSH